MALHFLDNNARRLAEAHRTDDLKPAAQQVAQALTNAAVRHNPREQTPLSPNVKLSQLSDWTGESRSNWRHMVEVGFALLFEYNWRTSQTIESVKKALSWARSKTPYNMPELGLQMFPYYGDDEYSDYGSGAIQIWRIAYTDTEAKPEDWGDRDMPDWYVDRLNMLVSGRKHKLKQIEADED